MAAAPKPVGWESRTWYTLFRLVYYALLPGAMLQAWAATEIRALNKWHHLPWGVFVFLLWAVFRPLSLGQYALAKWLHKKARIAHDTAVAARLGGSHVRGTSAE